MHDPSLSANDLAKSVCGPDRFDELVKRGMPGELINAAGRRYLLDRPNRRLGGVVDSIARVLSLFIGDPVIRIRNPRASDRPDFGQLFVVCLILMLAANACLIASYATGSKMGSNVLRFPRHPTMCQNSGRAADSSAGACWWKWPGPPL